MYKTQDVKETVEVQYTQEETYCDVCGNLLAINRTRSDNKYPVPKCYVPFIDASNWIPERREDGFPMKTEKRVCICFVCWQRWTIGDLAKIFGEWPK